MKETRRKIMKKIMDRILRKKRAREDILAEIDAMQYEMKEALRIATEMRSAYEIIEASVSNNLKLIEYIAPEKFSSGKGIKK